MKQEIIDQRNRYRVSGKKAFLTIVPVHGNEQSEIVFDRDLLEEVQQHCWRVGTGRLDGRQVVTGIHNKKTFLPLAHLVAGAPKKGLLLRYIDRDWTNCRASNLEHSTRGKLAKACGNGHKTNSTPAR